MKPVHLTVPCICWAIITTAFPDHCANNSNNFFMQVRQTSNTMESFNQPFANLQFTIISFLPSFLIPLQSCVFVFIIINVLKLETVTFETQLKTTSNVP